MTVLAMDWNATRLRAVLGAPGQDPLPLPLEPPALELPLAISFDKPAPEVGSHALRQCRSAVQGICQSFLPHLSNQPGQGPRWQGLDAHGACELIWRKFSHLGANLQGMVLTVPVYLQTHQANALRKLGEQARLPVIGSIPTHLSAALAGHAEQFWQRSVLVIDLDDHALSLGWVKAVSDKAHLVECRTFPHMGLKHIRERLIDGLADLFVVQHRRDPRDVPAAEQSLFDQLEPLIDAGLKGQAIQLGVHAQQWYKHLLVHPDHTAHFCAPFLRQALSEVASMLSCWPVDEWPRSILLTHDAGRLPGLVEALHSLVLPTTAAETKLPAPKLTNYLDEDFGEGLMCEDATERGGVLVLPPEAPARAAHGLAELFRRGILPMGHVETMAPLPRNQESGIRGQKSEVRGQESGIGHPNLGLKRAIGSLTPDS
jgi:hypothetical protein